MVTEHFRFFRIMANSYTSKQTGGFSSLGRFLLLLFLADLPTVVPSPGEGPEVYANGDRLNVTIVGPDYVTVGVPASVACVGNCWTCNYSMSLDGQAAQGQGNILDFTLTSWMQAIKVTCMATDKGTLQNATATKQLQVLVGPANVSITGPDVINTSMSYTYSCHAHCQPSCTYAWRMNQGAWIRDAGNVISVIAEETYDTVELTCKAFNNVSRMFVLASQEIIVMWSDPNLATRPEEASLALLLLLACIISAACKP